jgi:MFS family permease
VGEASQTRKPDYTTAGPAAKAPLFTPDFVLVCIACFFHFGSFTILLATIPLYVVQNLAGRETDVGLVMGIVALAALAIRPAAGWAVEGLGRKPVMLFAPAVFAIASGAYAFVTSVPMLLAFRPLHGMGIGTYATGSSVYVGDIAPPDRRGEALSYYGVAQNLSQAIGPAAGLYIYDAAGFQGLFATSVLMAVVAFGLTSLLKEKYVPTPAPRIAFRMFISTRALLPCLLVVGMAIANGSITSFISLYGKANGIANVGFFFIIFATTTLLSRPISGSLSDKLGRLVVAAPGLILISMALGMLALSGQWWSLSISAALLGLGIGTVQPALMALMVDITQPHERGSAMSTLGISMDLGMGIGSIFPGFIIEGHGYGPAFGIAAVMPLALLAIYRLLAVTGQQRNKP